MQKNWGKGQINRGKKVIDRRFMGKRETEKLIKVKKIDNDKKGDKKRGIGK